MPRSAWYTLGFAAAICLVCSVLVTSAAVSLEERQGVNKTLDKQKNVLEAAGLKQPSEKLEPAEVQKRFEAFEAVVVDLTTGQEDSSVSPDDIDQRKMTNDPAQSVAAERNPALVQRVANKAVVYKLRGEGGGLEMLILPIEGKGLWSTLYGFVALGSDLQTVEGITFYQHGETPGLGGEVDNPKWKALWPGRKVYGANGDVAIEVIKGAAGPATADPYRVDGLSGATITSRGVTHLLRFWLGEERFGRYLESLTPNRRAA